MKTIYMHQLYMGTVGDMKNLERHYSDMAEKGWMIDRIGVLTQRYRAVEPCKKRFFVDFLPQITAFDYPENEDAQEYRRICEESGWNFIAANKQFHVFCADAENHAPIPIHTDNAIHAKIYLKACRKYELPIFIFAVFMLWFFSPMGRGVELFLSNIMLFMAIGYVCFSIGFVWTFGFVVQWYIRAKKSAKHNLPMPHVNRHITKLRGKVFAAGAVALVVCMTIGVALEIIGGMPFGIGLIAFVPLLAVFVGLWLRRQINTKRRTRAGNIGLSIVVLVIMEIALIGGTAFAIMNMPFAQNTDSLDNRPALFLTDVGVTTPANSSNIRITGTPAVPIDYEYWESNSEGRVRTQVYRSVSKTLAQWLYTHFTEEFMQDVRDIPSQTAVSMQILPSDQAGLWGAEKVMMFSYKNGYAVEMLLWNGKTILRLSAEGLTMNFMNQAVQDLWQK